MTKKHKAARSCIKCCNMLPADEFAITPKGNLRRECKACFIPGPKHAVCQKCTRTLPLSAFSTQVAINGTSRRQVRCKACVRHYATSLRCAGCKETLGLDAFPRSLNGNRVNKCFECSDKRTEELRHRQCDTCKKVKPKTQFYPLFEGRHSTRCRECTDSGPTRGATLRKLDHNCLHCGTEIWTTRKPEAVQRVRYCRRACEKAGKLKDSQVCVSCGVRVKRADYPVFLDRVKRLSFRCKECVVAIREGRDIIFRASLSLRRIRHELLRRAQRAGQKAEIGIHQLRTMAKDPCVFCGGLTESMVLDSEKSPVAVANLRPVCGYCRIAKGKRDVDDIIAWAQRIADHHKFGQAKLPAGAPCRAPSNPDAHRELIREFSRGSGEGKTRKRNSSLIPPQIFEDRAMDETFEQRLARHAKVRQAEANEET